MDKQGNEGKKMNVSSAYIFYLKPPGRTMREMNVHSAYIFDLNHFLIKFLRL